MKKVIVSILALACGLCAYAKTLDELVAEIPPADSSNWHARVDYTQANYEDFAREFASYLAGDFATKNYVDMTASERKIRAAMTPFYALCGDKFSVPDAAGIRLSVPAFFKFTGITKYNEIKNAEWKLGGQTLSPVIIFFYAKAAKDDAYMASITIEQAKKGGFLGAWAKDKAKSLYYAPDAKAAYEEALDIEAALRSRGENNADAITSLKAVVEVEDFLYLKFIRATKIK